MSARPPHPGCADTRTRIHPKGQGSGSCPARGRTTPAKGGRNPAPARAGRGPRAGGLRRSGRRRQFPRNGRHGQGRVADPPIIGPTTASTSSGFSIGPDAAPAPGASPGHPASVRERSARADLNPPSGSGGTQYWTLLDCRLADQISFALQTGEGLRSIVVSVCASWPEREWPRHVDEPDLAGLLGRGTAKDRN